MCHFGNIDIPSPIEFQSRSLELREPLIIAGTRPELVKLAPIVLAFRRMRFPFKFVYTGQHYDYELSRSFINELGLPEPDRELGVRADSSATLTGQIIIQAAKAIRELGPSLVLVQGDTNTTLSATIASLKEGVPVAHVESGLRSYDWRMPEEHNRRMIDHVSSYLFAPTERAMMNVLKEKVPGVKHVTGNTVIDATINNMPKAEAMSRIAEKLHFEEFILATTHRAENVDNPHVLREFVEAFRDSPLPVVFPIHPRTVQRLRSFGLYDRLVSRANVQLLPPVGYFDFLILMKLSSLILTDSGGIQEEATSPPIRKRVVVMRSSTERPEAVESGFAKLAGTRKQDILRYTVESLECEEWLPSRSPFGNGSTGELIADLVAEIVNSERERLHAMEPPSLASLVVTS